MDYLLCILLDTMMIVGEQTYSNFIMIRCCCEIPLYGDLIIQKE